MLHPVAQTTDTNSGDTTQHLAKLSASAPELLNNGQKSNFDVTVKFTCDLLHRDVTIVSSLCETLSLKF